MDKALILKKIKEYYNIKTDAEFSRFLGISTQNMYTWIKRRTYDPSIILAKCPDIRAEWLLNFDGEMLKNTKTDIINLPEVQTTDTITISKDFYEVLLSQKDTIRILQETAISDRKIIVNLTALLSKRIVAEQDTTTEPAKCADAG